ncbi:hypothetical protein B0H13DRAFT_2008510 [Mycena leptocephala]|nr:hypothetical protein B0H13DRAFT_2008510 [Mycena leptocephala]
MKVRVCPILSSLPVFTTSSLVAALPLAGIALQAITCQVLHLLVPIRNLSGLAPTISTASWTGADVGGRWLCCADGASMWSRDWLGRLHWCSAHYSEARPFMY